MMLMLWLLIQTPVFIIMQDGRIDYNEFVAMMQKGNVPVVGRKGLENSFSIGFRGAFKQ